VAANPTNADILYAAGVNGGVWKTVNATAATPAWTPLTDQAFPGLSIQSLALSPLDPNVVFAGAGRVSSYSSDGGTQFGVGISFDGGASWYISGALASRNVRSIVPTLTLASGLQVVLAGTSSGVYRSANGGTNFSLISVGIPSSSVSDLVADPGVSNRFYAAVSGTVYRSEDTGATWVNASGSGFVVYSGARVLLSVHNSTTNDVVYAMVLTNGSLRGVFRSPDQGATWTDLGVPSPPILPGGQGSIHSAVLADRLDPTVVWISGDRQNTPFPNANGAHDYSGNVFAYLGGVWTNMVMNGANGTSPHADSRSLKFDAAGNIVQGNDGGIYRLNNPQSTSRLWSSLNGNITPTESHSAAYDPLSHVVFCGNQDTGTTYQQTPGGGVWTSFTTGDGGDVMVDADQTAHPGTSIRYSGYTGAPAYRSTYNSAGGYTGYTSIGLNIVSGPGAGQTLSAYDTHIQFYQHYVLNVINPRRLLIGTQNLYESGNQGDSLTNILAIGVQVGNGNSGNPGMAYGSRSNGVAMPDVFYVGSGTGLRHRVVAGGAITTLAYTGGSIRALAMDPQNFRKLYVLDTSSRVWFTPDEGVTWVNLSVNLPSLCSDVRTIEIFSPSASVRDSVLIVGGAAGVWQMRRPGSSGSVWLPLGGGFPHALVYDLRYNYNDNVLVAGTLGRGVWTLSQYFRGGGGTGLVAPATTTPIESEIPLPDRIEPPLVCP
jgi:hypothetical protein